MAERRRAGATTLAQANAFLPAFLPCFNARFAVPPAEPTPANRPLPPASSPTRCAAASTGARCARTTGARVLQLPRGPAGRSWSRVPVEVREHLDGGLAVVYQGQPLAHQVAPLDTPLLRARGLARPAPAALDAPTAPAPVPAPPSFRPSDLHP